MTKRPANLSAPQHDGETPQVRVDLRSGQPWISAAKLFERLPDAVVVTDMQAYILDLNPAAERLFGYTRTEAIGKPTAILLPSELAESVPTVVLDTLRKAGRWRGEVEFCRKDGSRGLMDSHVVALVFDTAGLPAITIGVNREINGGKLEQRDPEGGSRRMEEFLAMLAHELRTPLHTIRSATTLLAKVAPQDDKVQEATAVIGRQIAYLTQLVSDLFDCSRAELGKLPLQKELVDIGEVLHAVAERIQPTVDDHGLTLHRSVLDAPLLAQVDPVRLSQILVNLLDNAVKFSRSNGRIEMSAGAEHSDAVITVTDDGTGIEPSLLPHIWNSFVQGKAPSRAVDLGIGIGLSLVKRLVELHGGSVSAESLGAGMGARFVVRLPRAVRPPSL